MYIITIRNGNVTTEIHNYKRKLLSGKIVKGINTIDSFTFTMLPTDPSFNEINDYTTFVRAYNTFTRRYEFKGRVLCSEVQMTEQGTLTRSVTCECTKGYLCDSAQDLVEEQEWTFKTYFQKIAGVHNSQVEPYKKITLGNIATDIDGTTSFLCQIPRKNTWEAINENIIKPFGGEIILTELEDLEDGVRLDYVKEQGSTKSTEILIGKNMRSIIRERDSTEFVTRLIPLGAKISNDSEERYDITSVTDGGINYIEDAEAVQSYGIHARIVEFDNETTPEGLLIAAKEWLSENNKVRTKYTVNALDLSLLGLSVDDFEVGNTHPIKNHLLGIDDTARIIKKTIDITEQTQSSIELGEKFETLTEIQKNNAVTLQNVYNTLVTIEANYVTNTQMVNEINIAKSSIIKQTSDDIMFMVEEKYVGKEDNDHVVSMINLSKDQIDISSNRIKITSTNFTLMPDGTVTAKNGVFDNCEIKDTCKVYGTVLADTVCSNSYTVGGFTYRGKLAFGENEAMAYVEPFHGYALEVEGVDGTNHFESGVYANAKNGTVVIQAAKAGSDGTIWSGSFSNIAVRQDEIKIDALKTFLWGANTQYIITNELMVAKTSDIPSTNESAIRSVAYAGLTGWVESVRKDGDLAYTLVPFYLHFVHGILVEATTTYNADTMTEWLL